MIPWDMRCITLGIVLDLKKAAGALRYVLDSRYIQAIEEATPPGVHVRIKKFTYEDDVGNDGCDGILLIGGGRVSSGVGKTLCSANPPRYEFEKKVIDQCRTSGIPILGICRGCQMLNEAYGGTTEYIGAASAIDHGAAEIQHSVRFLSGTLLRAIYGRAEVLVNSLHFKEMVTIAEGFVASARSKDGVVEAIESTGRQLVLGVQWHPERMHQGHHSVLLRYFLERCCGGRNVSAAA
jgi:putative glutamine amidotransferase